ncbi:MAG: hypothetical protein DDT21_00378 [Syntrophomonadaceae bacterium]|nr:hypothetical protein [Bacillota bacterium]
MIKAENLWKSFPMRRDRPGFKEFIVRAPKFLKENNNRFWALKGVSLTKGASASAAAAIRRCEPTQEC